MSLTEERIREIIREELAAFYSKFAFPYPIAAPFPYSTPAQPCPVCGIVGCMTVHVTCNSGQQDSANL